MLSFVYNWMKFSDEFEEDLSSELNINNLDLIQTEVRYGRITSLLDDYGMIDNEFYFPSTLTAIMASRPLRVMDQVQYTVERPDESQQWKVVKILSQIDETWDNETTEVVNTLSADELSKRQQCREIANVVRVNRDTKVVEVSVQTQDQLQTLKYDMTKFKLDFMPCKGDMLTLTLKLDGTDLDELKNASIVDVQPLRQCMIGAGTITSWWREMEKGIIDDYIYFDYASVPSRTYVPKCRDLVRVQAIECEKSSFNRKSNWRAIRVVPCPTVNLFRQQTLDASRLHCPAKSSLMEELMRHKNGITLTSSLDIGVMERGAKKNCEMIIKNSSSHQTSCLEMKVTGHHDQWIQSRPDQFPAILTANESLSVNFNVEAKAFGKTKIFFIFNFRQNEIADEFSIGAEVLLEVRDPLMDRLAPNMGSSLDRKYTNVRYLRDGDVVVPGQRKKGESRRPGFVSRRLPEYGIPKRLKDLTMDEESAASLLDIYPVLGEELSIKNYSDKFNCLIHLEEISNWEKMQEYDMAGVTFRQVGEFLSLEVPGLAEKRPSLLMGDSVIATRSYDESGTRYEGCIHETHSKSVSLKFDSIFHQNYCGELYDVIFEFNRGPYKRVHQAVDVCAKHFPQVLFPSQVKLKPPQVNFVVESEDSHLNPSNLKVFKYKSFPVQSQVRQPKSASKTSKKRLSVAERLLQSQSQKSSPKAENGSSRRVSEVSFGPEWILPIFPVNKINQVLLRHTEVKKRLEWEFQVTLPYVPMKKTNQNKLNSLGLPILQWSNKNLNPEQRSAVLRILTGEARPLPYIIYGPPGTGKTVTVVEAIIQIFSLRLESRILVATPSNSAADLIVSRLHESGLFQFGDLARLNAFQRGEESIPDVVKPYSFQCKDEVVLAKVVKHRIVVTTCSSAGGLYKLALAEGHFTHCFIDEAGETTEPESMIPIGLLASQIILAGDPKQLGPVLQSPFSKEYGLELSFLERLSQNQLYERDAVKFRDHGCYDPVLVTKLIRNYRSHSQILKVSSDLFYDGDLIPLAPLEIQNLFVGMEFLPNKNCPIVFHGVRGDNYQEPDSPSWFNPQEALQTVQYLRQVLDLGVEPENIGIISPYRKQTSKLREIITSLNLPRFKIGSVEEFQGQERDVIIITTVRSSGHESAIANDVIRGLGFLRSEKRFNVAVTRAKSLLIVIGDPHLLVGDSSWFTFIEHCVKLNAYTGCDLPLTLSNVCGSELENA